MTEPLSADCVVIGSGIIGALTARQLMQQGASVTLLEAGPHIQRGEVVARFRNSPRKDDGASPYPAKAWAPYPAYQPEDNTYLEQAGPTPYQAQYLRQVGGTTWSWAAQAWRIVPNDMHMHSAYGVGVDWPVTYEELDPFYQAAEEIMGVSGAENTGSPRSAPFPMAPVAESWAMRRIRERLAPDGLDVVASSTARNSRSYGGRPACCGNNSCQPICPIDAQYHGGIAAYDAQQAGVRLIANAVVYRLEHDATGRIVAAHFYDQYKTAHRITATMFVLAANAIESPKLLLLSATDKYPNGLANGSGMVGRHLMDHASTSLVFDADEALWLGRGPQNTSTMTSRRDGKSRADYAAYRIDFSNASQVHAATQALIEQGVYGPALEKKLRFSAAHQVSMSTMLEVLPNPDNRITLGTTKDAMGIPRPRVHYAIDDYTRRGAQIAKRDFERIAALMGGTNLRFSADGAFTHHHNITGTLRMGHDPSTSVVDRFGRTHDHENLFIVGTAVMPTVATCNATHTGIALGLRTAHHILTSQMNAMAPVAVLPARQQVRAW